MSRVCSVRASILTHQARRSLRVFDRAKALHQADIRAGVVDACSWDAVSATRRAEYRLLAEAEIAAPPQFPRRDETVGRDQITRRDRARVLQFGGPSV